MASPVFFPNPQAFIMPRWQIEKSNLTGSTGSMARSDAVMSAAMRQPGLFSLVSRRHWPDADDVRVERHDQLAGPHLLPHAEIDADPRAPSSAGTG